MPTYTTQRAITDNERLFLQQLFKRTPTWWTRWTRSSENALVLRDYRSLYHADLESGCVVEEHYRFTAAKRFQEPEFGALIYFLRTDDERVLTFFDHSSHELGMRDADPLASGFVPRTDFTIVRAPRSALVIEKRFSGEPLATGAPLRLTVGSGEWPESDMCCHIPWDQLEARLSSGG